MKIAERVGHALRYARLSQIPQMTQGQAGKLMGVSRSAVAQYEAGKATPSEEQLRRLGEVVGRSPQWFYNFELEKRIAVPPAHATPIPFEAAISPSSTFRVPHFGIDRYGAVPADQVDEVVSFLGVFHRIGNFREFLPPGARSTVPAFVAELVDFVVEVGPAIQFPGWKDGELIGFRLLAKGFSVLGASTCIVVEFDRPTEDRGFLEQLEISKAVSVRFGYLYPWRDNNWRFYSGDDQGESSPQAIDRGGPLVVIAQATVRSRGSINLGGVNIEANPHGLFA